MLMKHQPRRQSAAAAATAAKSLQSCPTLCDPIDGSPPGSPVPGSLQARTLEWGAIAFSNAGKWKVKVKSLSRVRLFETPWTVAHQTPPSTGFSRQEYWSGVPSPSPRRQSAHLTKRGQQKISASGRSQDWIHTFEKKHLIKSQMNSIQKDSYGTSLVGLWLRLCLPLQGVYPTYLRAKNNPKT